MHLGKELGIEGYSGPETQTDTVKRLQQSIDICMTVRKSVLNAITNNNKNNNKNNNALISTNLPCSFAATISLAKLKRIGSVTSLVRPKSNRTGLLVALSIRMFPATGIKN